MQGAGKIHQVCCMWDTYVLMGATNRNETKKLTIPVVYMTIAEGKKLQRALEKYPTTLVARTYRRELPLVDLSSILLWCIGVTTALGAAYYSASSIRRYSENASAREQRKLQQQQQTGGREEEVRDQHEEIWELDTKHAVGFIALAGVFLTVFYYVKIGGVIPVLFALSSAATLTQVLPNLKVATILLSLAFCYDVFFVFLSPIFFGSSVMEDVATDWAGGTNMLGLGDIILPGMLLSFALRFDYSDATVGATNYFSLMAIGYAVGLALANMAVMITEMGQPALMYLVPTTLGVDQDDTLRMKKRSSDDPDYSAEAPAEILIGDSIGRMNDNMKDHVPLLGSRS
ncbi:hypothetical protein BBO99_00002392 [Phytophthora kernoviae]|uniref:Uncharacterized protein n=1 Tax=Phytophthora kernoviae TaxID=325452 RepID=A0A3R7KWZ8_9STRA|nr:hypothetical protein JM16_000629 [Phytophthora kernoviae]RLN02104.1 hypothetical protein BBI17_002217 [Phytophthora kernoviae]RLN83108.1 hypothetical protein BBO99_00002392 [Phytophthora kernoviae]